MSIDIADKKILLTGGSGFLGSFVAEELLNKGVKTENIRIPRSRDLDLRIWENCVNAVKDIDIVIHLAASVGGIGFNMKYPGDLLYDNAIMGIQLMEAARRESIQKFVSIGTVCSYPKFCPVPFNENDLWNGYPEETNAPYGVAKKILLVQAEAYRAQHGFNAIYLLPVNLYGPRDHFNTEDSHVIPALILKFIDAKEKGLDKIIAWGTGSASREFLYVEDAAQAIVLATEKYDKSDPVNLGSGKEVIIKDLVNMIKDMVGFEGEVVWDTSKPDGQPKRMLDVTKAEKEFDFKAKTDFEEGLYKTISWYRENILNK
ncbi:MAG: GDP-L-fucose synthase [Thermodesulfobacteriota bacterium]|nr:MAG: GDP-L-fucose synthase [Thermodesulfobacteriota bacterium]